LKRLEEERVERLKIEENGKLTQIMMNDEIQTLKYNLESTNRRPTSRRPHVPRQVISNYHIL